MCEPTTILLAISAASAVTGVIGQQQAASAQSAANQRQYENSMKAMAANVNQTNAEHMQQREGAMQKLQENDMAHRASDATATVAAGENGISGLSVDALLNDLSGKSGRYTNSVTTNYENAEQAINNQRENIGINAASQINNLKTPATPDYAGAALRIGTAMNDYYNPRIYDARAPRST